MTLAGFTPWPQDLADRYRREGFWTGDRLDGILAGPATDRPHAIALVDADRRLSYRELADAVERMAAGFVDLGIRSRDRVLLQLPNRVSFVVAALALMRAGAIPVYLLPAHRRSELTAIAEQAQPVAYIGPDRHDGFDHRALADELRAGTPSLRLVLIDGDPLPGQLRLESIGRSTPGSAVVVDPGDVAFLQLSGGTTGTPKLIPRSHDDYLYSVRQSNRVCGFDESTVLLVVLPAAHNFPMSSPGFLGALLAGGQVVLGASAAPEHAFALIARERVTVTSLVPPLALAWAAAAAHTPEDLTSLVTVQVGGASLVPQAARLIGPALGATLQQVFGMAEGLVCYTVPTDDAETTATGQGRPMSTADELLIVDDDDTPVPDGVAGHLLTRGPYTIRGYYLADAHNRRAFTTDGFYRTGDIVRRLPTGLVRVEGRSKDQINRGGEKIAAEEIEDLLLAHPLVHDAAVVAVPDPYLGERSCAVIVPTGPLGRAEILAFVRAHGIAKHKIPDHVEFVDAFPITGVGKTSRAQLRRSLVEQYGTPALTSPPQIEGLR